jgi:sulfur-oxidizing protein SoxY
MTLSNAARRRVLQQGGALAALVGCGLLTAGEAHALVDASAFDLKTFDDALRALGAAPAESKEVVLTTPDIAENGAVVPVAITSRLPKTQEIYILVEANPLPLTAGFTIGEGMDPFVSTRIKMAQTTNVHAVVRADGKLYRARKETKVTLGGCGG